MQQNHSFSVQSFNAPTVLPRIALVFARRGTPLEHLSMSVSADGQSLDFALGARCDATEAARIVGQLRRIVEVRQTRAAPATHLEALGA